MTLKETMARVELRAAWQRYLARVERDDHYPTPYADRLADAVGRAIVKVDALER